MNTKNSGKYCRSIRASNLDEDDLLGERSECSFVSSALLFYWSLLISPTRRSAPYSAHSSPTFSRLLLPSIFREPLPNWRHFFLTINQEIISGLAKFANENAPVDVRRSRTMAIAHKSSGSIGTPGKEARSYVESDRCLGNLIWSPFRSKVHIVNFSLTSGSDLRSSSDEHFKVNTWNADIWAKCAPPLNTSVHSLQWRR